MRQHFPRHVLLQVAVRVTWCTESSNEYGYCPEQSSSNPKLMLCIYGVLQLAWGGNVPINGSMDQ